MWMLPCCVECHCVLLVCVATSSASVLVCAFCQPVPCIPAFAEFINALDFCHHNMAPCTLCSLEQFAYYSCTKCYLPVLLHTLPVCWCCCKNSGFWLSGLWSAVSPKYKLCHTTVEPWLSEQFQLHPLDSPGVQIIELNQILIKIIWIIEIIQIIWNLLDNGNIRKLIVIDNSL